MGAGGVIAALRNGPFPEPAYAWLYEVNNATGHRGGNQFADALVISCWPSRGIWFAGIEVKVSRYDWTRELSAPAKSAEIQAYCDYWWVAAPKGVVPLAEVPETWGLLEVDGKKVHKTKEAPRLTPKPLTQDFVASCLRNEAAALDAARRTGLDEGRRKAMAEFDVEAVAELRGKLREAEHERDRFEQLLQWEKQSVKNAHAACRAFEAAAGLPEHTILEAAANGFGMRSAGECFRAAQMLRELNAEFLAKQFSDVADALRALPKTGQ